MTGLFEYSLYVIFDVALFLNAYVESASINNFNKPSLHIPSDMRLPKAVVPLSYDIKIIPFLDENNFTFKGEVTIWVYAKEETSNITLHASNLKIDNTSLNIEHLQENNNTLKQLEIINYENNTSTDFLIIYLKESLQRIQRYKIRIVYEGIINNNQNLVGFYMDQYTENNETKWVAATYFEPTFARTAFPCFDEPAFKANFKINVARPKNMTSISNMPKEGSSVPVEGLPDYEWDHYEQSPRMSTYLVCFVVSDFEKVTSGIFSVWARREVISQVNYVLSIGPRILQFYESYLQTDYSLEKMDMVALPSLKPKGMENWGLITYRESVLLYEDGVTPLSNLMDTTVTVAHELAHQFFGNLVTLKWWSDTWLNEGFAQYFSYLGVNEVKPECNISDRFIFLDVLFALDEAAKNITHSVVFNVAKRDEIVSIFNPVTYAKGSSIVYMMEHFLTQPVLHKGLVRYINTKKYFNAEGDDLFAALTTVAHEDRTLKENITVRDIMNSWTLKEGHPIVTVTRNYSDNTVNFTQNRFFSEYITKDSQSLWWIPLSYTTKNIHDFNNTVPKLWLEEIRTKTINLTAQSNEWLIVNLKHSGFYVVNYDLENWMMIIGQLQDAGGYNQIHVINRMQILHDLFAFAKIDMVNYDLALEASKYLIHEHSDLPWSVALVDLLSLNRMLINTQQYEKFRQYLIRLISPIYSRTGFDLNNQNYLMGNRVRYAACLLGVDDCVENCNRKFLEWKNVADPDLNNPIDPSLRGMIYCVVARYGKTDDWEFLWQRFVNFNSSWDQEILLIQGLSCSQSYTKVITYLDRTTRPRSGLKFMKILAVFITLGENIYSLDFVTRYLKASWGRLVDNVEEEQLLFILSDVTANMRTVNQLDEVREFFAQTNISETFRAEVYAKIQKNINFLGKHLSNIANWVIKLNV